MREKKRGVGGGEEGKKRVGEKRERERKPTLQKLNQAQK